MKPNLLLCLLAAAFCFTVAQASDVVVLTAYERAQGWRLLFDGGKPSDWRGFRSNKLPPNWSVVQGALVGQTGPALVSVENYEDFELLFDWRVSTGGHGEVYFRVTEDGASPEASGAVMELSGHGDTLATNGGLNQPDRRLIPQFDMWYRAKLVVYGNVVEYWLNGDRVLTYTIDSSAWKTAVATSRFSGFRDYAALRRGAIALSGAGVEFRNIRIRVTP